MQSLILDNAYIVLDHFMWCRTGLILDWFGIKFYVILSRFGSSKRALQPKIEGSEGVPYGITKWCRMGLMLDWFGIDFKSIFDPIWIDFGSIFDWWPKKGENKKLKKMRESCAFWETNFGKIHHATRSPRSAGSWSRMSCNGAGLVTVHVFEQCRSCNNAVLELNW